MGFLDATPILGQIVDYGLNSRSSALARQHADVMSRNAYTRASRDLKRAGLNPIIAAQGGALHEPAYTAPPTAPSHVAEGVTSARQGSLLSAQVDATRAAAEQSRAQAASALAAAANTKVNTAASAAALPAHQLRSSHSAKFHSGRFGKGIDAVSDLLKSLNPMLPSMSYHSKGN